MVFTAEGTVPISPRKLLTGLSLLTVAVLLIYKAWPGSDTAMYLIPGIALGTVVLWSAITQRWPEKSAAEDPADFDPDDLDNDDDDTRVVEIKVVSQAEGNQYLGLGPEWCLYDYDVSHIHDDNEDPDVEDTESKVIVTTSMVVTKVEKMPSGRDQRVAEIRTVLSLDEANSLLQNGTAWDLDKINFMICEDTERKILIIVLCRYESEADRKRLKARDVSSPAIATAPGTKA